MCGTLARSSGGMMARDCLMNVGCGHEFILIGIRASERLSELFRQIVAVQLNLDHDRAAVHFGLEPDQRAFVVIEPFAHFPKALGKIGPNNAHMDHPHKGSQGEGAYRDSVGRNATVNKFLT